jgi:ABC-type nickel/cobalt efflux system permease component RcnA
VTPKELVQLAFALSNGLSFALTIRHSWRAKLAGSLVLVVAHPMVAVYFAVTGQPFFIIGNVIMTGAGLYGSWRALRARRHDRQRAEMADLVRRGFDAGMQGALWRALEAVAKDAPQGRVDNTPHWGAN